MTQMTTCDLHNATIARLSDEVAALTRELAAEREKIACIEMDRDHARLDAKTERERADRNQEDAERYRWLRDTDTAVVAWIEEDGPRWSIEGRDGHKITRDKLDAAIDAARRK